MNNKYAKKVDEDVIKKHEQMLYPVCRIRSKNVGGSGTVIYSDKDEEDKYHTFILTNHHVIENSIKVQEKWDPSVGMEIKKEMRSPVDVEFFYYENFSKCKGVSGSYKGIVRDYLADADIAILELDKHEEPVEYVAKTIPEEDIQDIKVFDEVWAVGASLGHEPLATYGHIVFMDEIIDDYPYWMSTAQTIFGNSGGAVFRYSKERDRYEFIGIPSRVAVTGLGFSQSPITHMGWFIPPTTIYKFLRENDYEFIFNPDVTYEECMEKKKKKRERAKKLAMAKLGEVVDIEDLFH